MIPAENHPAANSLESPNERRQILIAGTVIAAIALAAYSNTFGLPTTLDDPRALVDNPSIRSLGNLRDVLIPPNSATTGGRPILNLSFALNYAWTGFHVWSYHAVNLAVHILSGLTLFGVARRTFHTQAMPGRFREAALPLAALIAVLWTLHPLQTESVTYLSQRAESLMGLFYLFTLYAFVRGWPALSVTACLLAMGTKEVAVTAPVIVLLYDRAFLSPSFRQAISRRRTYYLALGGTWLVVAFLVAFSHPASRGAGFGIGTTAKIYALTELKAIVTYLKLALWPHPLVFDYGNDLWLTRLGQAAPYGVIIAAALGASVAAWRRSPPLGFLALSFFILLSPTSSFVPVASQPIAENRMYLPLASVIALAVTGVHAWFGRKGLVGLCALALVSGALTRLRNGDYDSAVSIWRDTVAKEPGSSRALNNLGFSLAQIPGHEAEATGYYEAALRIRPDFSEAHYNLAFQLDKLPDRQADAVAQFEASVRQKLDAPEAQYNFALALANLPGREREAVAHLEQAIRARPDFADAHNNLGIVLAGLPGRLADAISQMQEAVRLKPQSVRFRVNLANALRQAGRLDDARNELKRAHELDPSNKPAADNLRQLDSKGAPATSPP